MTKLNFSANDFDLDSIEDNDLEKGSNANVDNLSNSQERRKNRNQRRSEKKLESEKENVLIVDEPVWNIKPEETYSGKRFSVALGNKFLVSQVIPDDDNLDTWRDKGYKILSVPIEFRPDFLDDIERALCDFAGISSSELSKYISTNKIYTD